MGATSPDSSHILHCPGEFTCMSSSVLGQTFAKHDKLFLDVACYCRLSGGHYSYAFWADCGTTW